MQVSTDPNPAAAFAAIEPGQTSHPRHALLIDVEPATAELIAVWLSAEGWRLCTQSLPADPVGLILIELAFPRHADRQRLAALAEVWPGVPVIVLSPTFFADTPARGDVARQLGAAAVLPTPVARNALLAAVRGVSAGPR